MEDPENGVVASGMDVVEIAETTALLARGDAPFGEGELRYARSTSDPERRLAARLAAKRVCARLLGGGVEPADIEVTRRRGHPPGLALSTRAEAQLRRLGGTHTLVSLTHGVTHAAASVLILTEPGPDPA